MKRSYILIMALLVLVSLCACRNVADDTTVDDENAAAVADILESIGDNRRPGLYGTSLNNTYVDNAETLMSKDGKVEIKVGINNEYSKAEYGFIVFVDGARVPFKMNESDKEKMMHTIVMDEEEAGRVVTVTFSDEYFEANKDAYVSIATLLNPSFMIKSTDYVSFLPHHALAAYNFYVVRKESGDGKPVSVDDELILDIDLPDEINSMYTQESTSFSDPDSMEGETKQTNALDSAPQFLFSKLGAFANIESCFACEKGQDFNVKIGCIGKSGNYRLSLYINHELVPAFNGKEYFDVNVDRDKLKVIDVNIDKNVFTDLDECNCMYLVAVPTDPIVDDTVEYVRPLKTNSQLLFVSEDSEKVNEFMEKYGHLSDENLSDDETTSEPESGIIKGDEEFKPLSTSAENTEATKDTTAKEEKTTEKVTEKVTEKATEKATEKPTEKATEKVTEKTTKANTYSNGYTAYSDDDIRDIWCFENGTVLVQCRDWTIHAYDTENKRIKSAGINGNTDVKKLDNGIAILDSFDFTFAIYDTELKLIKKGKLPYNEGDEVTFTVSNDGKSIIYCAKDKNLNNNIYIDSVSLNSKKLVCKLADSSQVGEVAWIDDFYAFDGKTALFIGSYNAKISSVGGCEQYNCFGSVSSKGVIKKQVDDADAYKGVVAKGSNMAVVDNANDDGVCEMWSLDKGSRKISFPTTGESYGVNASENLKYVATQARVEGENKMTIRIYEYSSMKLLYKGTFNSDGRHSLDFVESKNRAYIVEDNNKVVEIKL